MKKNTYHHGHLKDAMIESGIRLLNAEGIKGFSLRKVAARCGVSSSAPYTYFESREALLNAMESHVNAKLLWRLHPLFRTQKTIPDREFLLRLSTVYMTFFLENPHYFTFLLDQNRIQTIPSAPTVPLPADSPLKRLYQSCCHVLYTGVYQSESEHNHSFKKKSATENANPAFPELEQESRHRILTYLCTIHGLLLFLCTPGFSQETDWTGQLPKLLAPALDLLLAPSSLIRSPAQNP